MKVSQKILSFFNNVGKGIKNQSPAILTGIGIAGMLSTVVVAVAATPQAVNLLKEKKEKEYDESEKMPVKEVVKTAWKPYIPAMILGTISTVCIIDANHINAKRSAALAAAYTLSEESFKDYREKVIETVGKKKEEGIKDEVAKKKIEKSNLNNADNVVIIGEGTTLCYDLQFNQPFYSDIETIKKAVNECNRRLRQEMFISLNEFYQEIGIKTIGGIGDELGWNVDEEIELYYSSQLLNDNRPCLTIDYQVVPRYDFRNLM